MLILLLMLIASPVWAADTASLTLADAYARALRQSETVAIQGQEIQAARARYLQSLGGVLPHLEVNASELLQDRAQTSGGEGATATFSRRSRPEVAITLTQPLFQGLQEFHALKASRADRNKNQFEWERAKQLLFLDVTRAFYTVYELEEEAKIRASILETLQKRRADLRERIRIGKSRETDRLSLEAEIATAEAEMEGTQGLIRTARELLAFLMGVRIEAALIDQLELPRPVPAVEHYLAELSTHPELEASREEVRIAESNLGIQKGERLPFVDMEANYYPYRVGFLSDIDWDVLFRLNVPIFRGGVTRGRIREARAELKQSELANEERRRRTELDTRNAYVELETAQARSRTLKRAAQKAAANYRAQSDDYDLGLVDHLEVLQSLRDWQERQLEASRATYRRKVAYTRLQVAAGRGPDEVLP